MRLVGALSCVAGLVASLLAVEASAAVILIETFDSYSANGVFTVDGGSGWAGAVTGSGNSINGGLVGSGKGLFKANYTREIDLSSASLDPFLVDPVSDRRIGGAGVEIWTSFYMRTGDASSGAFNAIIGFESSTGFRTRFENGFFDNRLNVNQGTGNGTTIASSDLRTTTRVLAKWNYTGASTGQIQVWLNPTSSTEAGLGGPDAITPGGPGFIESFDRINFLGNQPNADFIFDDLVIATSFAEANGNAAVPEPTSLLGFIGCVLSTIFLRRSREARRSGA